MVETKAWLAVYPDYWVNKKSYLPMLSLSELYLV